MVTIERLWAAEELPIRDGLYRAEGTSRSVRLDSTLPGGLAVLEKFDLDGFLCENPDDLTSIDVTLDLPFSVAGTVCYLLCGEGSYGSEGFFGVLDESRNLVWVVYLEHSNPFITGNLGGTQLSVTSTAGLTLTVDCGTDDFRIAQRGWRRH